MYTIQDHPVVKNLLTTGTPDGYDPDDPHCPVCGKECELIYRAVNSREILGCDRCIRKQSAWSVDQCFPPKQED